MKWWQRQWVAFVYTGGAVGYVKFWTRKGAERWVREHPGEDAMVYRRRTNEGVDRTA